MEYDIDTMRDAALLLVDVDDHLTNAKKSISSINCPSDFPYAGELANAANIIDDIIKKNSTIKEEIESLADGSEKADKKTKDDIGLLGLYGPNYDTDIVNLLGGLGKGILSLGENLLDANLIANSKLKLPVLGFLGPGSEIANIYR